MILKSSNESGIITDIDSKNRIVKGYFSIFGNIDSDNDIIHPGAYAKTIKENSRIKHLYQHNPSIPLSSVRSQKLKLYEDAKGLGFESQISDTSWGRDVIKLYEDGVIDEHSVGFKIVKAKKEASGIRNITEIMLMEGSTVTWGANDQARFTSLKSDSMIKSLRNGNYENEEIFDLMEIYLAQQEPVEKSLQNNEPLKNTLNLEVCADALNQFLNTLNH